MSPSVTKLLELIEAGSVTAQTAPEAIRQAGGSSLCILEAVRDLAQSTEGAAETPDFATQEEAEAGESHAKVMSPLRTAQAIAALGGGGGMMVPQVYYVETNGDDEEAMAGDPAHPWQTGTAAYEAGLATSQPFVIHFGLGAFEIELSEDFSTLCRSVVGMGCKLHPDLHPATILEIIGDAGPVVNADGLNGLGVRVHAQNLHLNVRSSGGKVEVHDGNTYTGGNGGGVEVFGPCSIGWIGNGGGGSVDTSSSGSVNGGSGSDVVLAAGVCARGGTIANLGSGGADFEPSTGASEGGSGSIYCDGVDMRGCGFSDASLHFGRTSYIMGPSLYNDLGGNAVYPIV